MEALSTAQDDSSGANPSSIKSEDSSPRPDSRSGSPPPNCAICLGTCKNKSFTDSCFHQFCFSCLLTWSKVKAECPLCKQAFRSIIHNVQSNHQYEEYLVEQRQTEESSSRVDIDLNRVSVASHRFRYRTTLTLPRRETIAIQQFLRHYPFMADVLPSANARVVPARRRRSPSSFRRTVYRHNLWARPLPDFTGRFRDCSPEFYRYNDTQVHRLVPWLNRELHYLLNENAGHISYVMTRILDLLPQHHINSTEFREAMHRYFGDRTDHFLHELYCFASTPYDMTGYDRNVQYTTDSRISTMVNEVISSTESEASADSDIVMVSSSEPAEPPPGPSRFPVPAYPQSYISQPTVNNSVIPIETISQSDTDDDSSEVMVVGYIKPPQERTPEIVDLLGSDSDVIVQDNPPAEPVPVTESQESRPVNSVKLTLKRYRTSEGRADSDSDDSCTYRPPPRRRRRPQRSAHSTHSAHATSSTQSPHPIQSAHSAQPAYSASISESRPRPGSPLRSHTRVIDPDRDSHSTRSSLTTTVEYSNSSTTSSSTSSSSTSETSNTTTLETSNTTTSSDSDYSDDSTYPSSGVKKKSKKKSNRKRSKKKSSRSRRKEKKSSKSSSKDALSKRKSHSGKGVKSSKKLSNNEWSCTPPEQNNVARDQPSTSSGTGSRERRGSPEKIRLRSVVNMVYNRQKDRDESVSSTYSQASKVNDTNDRTDTGSSPGASKSRRHKTETSGTHGVMPTRSRGRNDSSSDSEDNLPLNLTLQKMSPPSPSW